MAPINFAVTALSFAAVLGLPACSPDSGMVQRSLASGREAPSAADFVAASRPDKLDYIPVASAGSDRNSPARTEAEVAAAEAEMDALRIRIQAQGAAARRAAGAAPGAAKAAAQP
jgi:hypothetical protein